MQCSTETVTPKIPTAGANLLPITENRPRHISVATLAKNAGELLEWLELGGSQMACDLAVSCLDALICEGHEHCEVRIAGLTATGPTPGSALRAWCGHVLRDLEQLNGVDPLVTFFLAFGGSAPDKFHAVTLAAAKLGAGSWVDPTLPAQRVTSHFYEIEMFGVLGRADSPDGATDNWRAAALNQLGARAAAALAGVAA
jgi:hypothetical protein